MSELVEAARAERDRRASSYPEKIRQGADAEALSVDYQCWVAIAEWLETGRFFSFAGGADPDSPTAPIIRWPELEVSAERALAKANARCDRLFTAGAVKAGEYEQACVRRSELWAVHRKVQLRRTTIDQINRELRDDRDQRAREAA